MPAFKRFLSNTLIITFLWINVFSSFLDSSITHAQEILPDFWWKCVIETKARLNETKSDNGFTIMMQNGKLVMDKTEDAKWELFVDGKSKWVYDVSAIPSLDLSLDDVYKKPYDDIIFSAKKDGKYVMVINGNESRSYDYIESDKYKNRDTYHLHKWATSSDHQEFAYAAKEWDKWMVVRNQMEWEKFDDVWILTYAPTWTGFTYTAKSGNVWRIIRDNILLDTAYDSIDHITYWSDAKKLAYVGHRNGKYYVNSEGMESVAYGYVWRLIFSQDSKNLAYITEREGKYIIIKNGVEVATHKSLDQLRLLFSYDGEKLIYTIPADWGKRKLVVNWKESREFDNIWDILLSSQGHIISIQQNNKWYVVKDGKLQGKYDEISNLSYAPDFKNFSYSAREWNDWFVFKDWEKFWSFESVNSIKFSPDSKSIVFTATKDWHNYLLKDGKIVRKGGESIWYFDFSPDGTSFSYHLGTNKEEKEAIVFDGVKSNYHDAAIFDYLSSDGSLRFLVQDGDYLIWSVCKNK